MDINEISCKEYDNLVKEPFSVFDSSAFCELNRWKVDDVKYLVFNDGKNRFYLIAGIKDGVVKFPFSASFSMLANISFHNKIICYHEAVKAFNFVPSPEETLISASYNKELVFRSHTILSEL